MINASIIFKFVNERYNRPKIRIIKKGHEKLRKECKLFVISQLKDLLSQTKLNNSSLSESVMRQGDFDAELSIRQYFFYRILGMSFNKSFLYSVGSERPLRHPLPKEWRNALTGKGVKVDNFSCAVLWRTHSFIIFGHGILQELKGVCSVFKKQTCLGRYVYFDQLTSRSISNNASAHNVMNWYLQWKSKDIKINSICHSANDVPQFKLGKLNVVKNNGLPQLRGLSLFKYITFVVYASIYSFICLFYKPVYGFLLGEVVKLKRVELARDVDLARDYLFHNSLLYYRPIWTYLAEKKGSRVLFYFYSTHTDYFYRTYIEKSRVKDGPSTGTPWHLMSWSHYLVWDEFHVSLIKRFDRYNSIIENVGHIWFYALKEVERRDIPENSVAVFDVLPFNASSRVVLGLSFDYYVPEVSNKFLNDIYEVLVKVDHVLIHKMKRINIKTHKKYSHNIKKLELKTNYRKIHPYSDALQLIQKTTATISIPFTSTALIAKQEGKLSVYYDPSGLIQKDDEAAHGIPILSGINELRDWVENLGR